MKIKISRAVVLVLLIVTVLSLYVLRLMWYQLVNGKTYRSTATQTYTSTLDINAARGQILDRSGKVLVGNQAEYDLVFQHDLFPTKTTKASEENLLLWNLTRVLKHKNEAWNDSLPLNASGTGFTGSASDKKKLLGTLKVKSGVPASRVLELLCKRYGISGSDSAAQKRTVAGIRYTMELMLFSRWNVYTFATNVSLDTITRISERSDEYPGVEVSGSASRDYLNGSLAAQVIGTLGAISPEEYKTTFTKKLGYTINDTVGKSGIEKTMESYLKGQNGVKTITTNIHGKVLGQKVTTQPKPGYSVELTIDESLQKVLQSALKETIQKIRAASGGSAHKGATARCGAAVVINRETGEILAMASEPTYSLKTYSKDFSKLVTDENTPLLNRCVSSSYRPGSSFKPVVALAALQNGVITKSTSIATHSVYTLGGIKFGSEASGVISIVRAISVSNNYFFYNVGRWTGIKKIDNMALLLGLGKKTGVELPGESSGVLTGYGKAGLGGQAYLYPGDVVQASIGQSFSMFTPVQLANYVATMLNDGTRYQLHIVKAIKSYDGSKTYKTVKPKVLSKGKISQSVLDTVKQGMGQVTENGTASEYFANYPMKVGGKTGTSQISGKRYYNSVFVSFAPYDNPKIVVAAVVERGYYGAAVSYLARRVYDAYFYGKTSG